MEKGAEVATTRLKPMGVSKNVPKGCRELSELFGVNTQVLELEIYVRHGFDGG